MNLKSQYNALLAQTRLNLTTLAGLRSQIEQADPTTKGSSAASIQTALENAFKARTFAGYEGDLDSKENPYRSLRKKAATAGRVGARRV